MHTGMLEKSSVDSVGKISVHACFPLVEILVGASSTFLSQFIFLLDLLFLVW